MSDTRYKIAYALLIVCAAARLLLQMAAMPPYAGLDEVYHVARLAFVRAEHRNPTSTEASIPPYLMASIAAAHEPASSERSASKPAAETAALHSWAMPAMGEAGDRWPSIVASRGGRIVADRPLTAADVKPYVVRNYEAQQTSIYYALVAPLAPLRSAIFELKIWRALSVLFALITVIATAEIGRRFLGPIGILGGAVVVSIPTWETLVVRASDDAFACMLAAVAVAISVAAPRRLFMIAAEAIAWGLALNAKMYTWPLLIILPLLWRRQKAAKSRVVAVVAVSVIAIVLTFAELSSRTSNEAVQYPGGSPLGVVALSHGTPKQEANANIGEIVRVTIASAAWTSGQHNDALRPAAIALYLGPVIIAIIVALRRQNIAPAALTLGAFALAQTYNVIVCVLARRAGSQVPIGGKEGWYWFVLVPILIPTLLVPALARWRFTAWWIVIWDVVITDVALFHDFAGMSSPAHGSMLFRWGPLQLPFTAHLGGIGVGPFAAWTIMIRLAHLAAFFGLESFLQDSTKAPLRLLNDRNADIARAS
ncbi:MAG: hypothetical protein QOK37_1255 [Thermoanaerobaculia bacterium]|jgi:hypothetical protein|nr:hypothetical protein [Thermoanaerobaculia bacterium]